jgi:hypothetical protein
MTAENDKLIVILIDESSAMSAVMRDKTAQGTESTKTNAERVATSVNNLLKQLTDGPACQVAIVGYRSGVDGNADIGCRWNGGLVGREFVPSSDLAAACRVESRTRQVPLPNGSIREEQLDFSVWYEPVIGGKAPQIAAFKFCRDLVERHTAAGAEPLILHIFTGASGDGNPQKAVADLLALASKPLLVQCHLATSAALITTAFPAKQMLLASMFAKDIFSRASELTAAMRRSLNSANVPIHATARGMVHNAKMADVIRCLQLSHVHVARGSGAGLRLAGGSAVESVTRKQSGSRTKTIFHDTATNNRVASHAGEPVALLVILLDRSVDDPFSGNLANPCRRLQDAGNEMLKQLSTKDLANLAIDTAIVSYGLGTDGQPDIRGTFEGPLAGRAIVRNAELPAGAIRVEEADTQVPNGVGGLITVKKKTPIYFDVEPAAAVPPQAGFAAAASIVADWCAQHPTGLPPTVLHLTRGRHAAADIAAAVGRLVFAATASGNLLIHHLVFTETPHKSLAYPASDSELETEELRALWQASSPVPEWERLQAAKRPYIAAGSRGFVINGKFDIIGEEFSNSLVPALATSAT